MKPSMWNLVIEIERVESNGIPYVGIYAVAHLRVSAYENYVT